MSLWIVTSLPASCSGAMYATVPDRASAIVASAAVHDGWLQPAEWTRDGQTMYVIEKAANARPLGGHAFCIVGYNEVGFLIQNSWGAQWGRNGFATLPYDDWLESAYDAWVARPGVHSILSQRSRTRLTTVTGGGLADAPGPDLGRLAEHVINLGNNGRLSTGGRFVSAGQDQACAFKKRARSRRRSWNAGPACLSLWADSERLPGLPIGTSRRPAPFTPRARYAANSAGRTKSCQVKRLVAISGGKLAVTRL